MYIEGGGLVSERLHDTLQMLNAERKKYLSSDAK